MALLDYLKRWRSRASLVAFTLGVLSFQSACVSLPSREEALESLNLPDRFSQNGEIELLPNWWQSFEDPELNDLMEEALRENFSLRTSWARLAQAEAVLGRSRSFLFPSLTGSGSVSDTQRENIPGSEGDSYSGSLSASYEIDLWSSIRNTAEAARLDRDASRENLQAAAISLSAQLTSVYFQLKEQRGQLAILEDQIEVLSDTLEVIQTRFRRGQVDSLDVFQQERLLEARKGNRYDVLARIAVLEHTLAILVGREPVSAEFATGLDLPDLPSMPSSGIPAELIQRRPDVRSAFRTLLAADRRTAVAVADQLPVLRLTGSLRSDVMEPDLLFDSWVSSLAAGLTQPLFDGGLRKSEVQRARAVAEAQLNNYTLTVLTALKEVEDALIQEQQQIQTIASLRRQVELAEAAVNQSRERYLRGAGNFLRVLDAQQTLQSLERTLLTARRQQIDIRIDLARALAGELALAVPEDYPEYRYQ